MMYNLGQWVNSFKLHKLQERYTLGPSYRKTPILDYIGTFLYQYQKKIFGHLHVYNMQVLPDSEHEYFSIVQYLSSSIQT